MKHVIRILSLFVALWVGSAHAGADEIAVIVNPGNTGGAMSQGDLRPIFQTTKTNWPNGDKILVLQMPDGDSARKGFDAAVLGLDPDRVARYWVDRKIRGGNPPPKSAPSAAAVVKIVASKKEAIGYVSASELNSSVKVVARIRGGQVVAP